jgi:hypothetical protein
MADLLAFRYPSSLSALILKIVVAGALFCGMAIFDAVRRMTRINTEWTGEIYRWTIRDDVVRHEARRRERTRKLNQTSLRNTECTARLEAGMPDEANSLASRGAALRFGAAEAKD